MKSNIFFCHGCTKNPKWIATGYVCPVWSDKTKTIAYRHGANCPFNPPPVVEKKKGFVNPIKASKRGRK